MTARKSKGARDEVLNVLKRERVTEKHIRDEYIARGDLCSGVWDADLDAHPDHSSSFRASNYNCLILRDETQWTYCAYVLTDISHPWTNHEHVDLSCPGGALCVREAVPLQEEDDNSTIGQGTTGYLWGFHCDNERDLSPVDCTRWYGTEAMVQMKNKHYWTYEEVQAALIKLAAQLRAVEDMDFSFISDKFKTPSQPSSLLNVTQL